MTYSGRITIVSSTEPADENINDELQWFCNSLGLFGSRDKDKSCFRLFIVLLKATKTRKDLTSDEIAEKLKLSRGTVIHHMHKLQDSGLVISRGNTYSLRVDNLQQLIYEIERDMTRTMASLKKAAEELDKKLEL